MIKARVNIETSKKKYKHGEIIREKLSSADIAFLKKNNFIISEDDEVFSGKESSGNKEALEHSLDGTEIDMEGFGFLADNAETDIVYKNEAELQKMKKEELVEYAAGFGLELDEDALKQDLIIDILNFLEEQMA